MDNEKRKPVKVELPELLARDMKILAAKRGMKLYEIYEEAAKEYLEKHQNIGEIKQAEK